MRQDPWIKELVQDNPQRSADNANISDLAHCYRGEVPRMNT